MNNLLQRDIEIHRISAETQKFEYQLLINGDPCKAMPSDYLFDFGLVNINPSTGDFHVELYMNSENIPSPYMEDPNTFIIPINIKS